MKSSLMGLSLFCLIQTATANIIDHPTEIIIALKKNHSIEKMDFSFSHSVRKLTGAVKHRGELVLLELPKALKSVTYIKELNNRPDILWAEANPIFIGDPREFTPNDPRFPEQFHHKIMLSEKAWGFSKGKSEVIVAVTDDGYNLEHEDLSAIYFRNELEVPDNGVDDDENGYIDDVIGWNFNENNNNVGVSGWNGSHGTHVAGIVAADFDNGLGVVGHGPKIKVMPLKFFGDRAWTGAMIMEAYKYAADNGAKIITTSYNIDGMSKKKIYLEAVSYAHDKGLIIFNSAGNGNEKQSPRTKLSKVVLVASGRSAANTSKHDKKSRFSNYGHGVDIMAPGDPILSASKLGKYIEMSGTSMAAPNAAGAAALIWSVNPQWSRNQVIAKLMSSADDVDALNPEYKHELGNGRVNSFRALTEEVRPPSVRQAWYSKKEKLINIHLKGILDETGISRGGIILENSKGNLMSSSLRAVIKYDIGVNILQYKVTAKRGSYRVRMISSAFKGPFGDELDGDSDGTAGGEFVLDFKID